MSTSEEIPVVVAEEEDAGKSLKRERDDGEAAAESSESKRSAGEGDLSPGTIADEKAALLAKIAAFDGNDGSFLWIDAADLASVSQLRADKEVVMAALPHNGLELKWASVELKADPEVVLAAIADPHAGDDCREWPRSRAARSRMTEDEWGEYKEENGLDMKGRGYDDLLGPVGFAHPAYPHCATIVRVSAIEDDAERTTACADPATLAAVTAEFNAIMKNLEGEINLVHDNEYETGGTDSENEDDSENEAYDNQFKWCGCERIDRDCVDREEFNELNCDCASRATPECAVRLAAAAAL